VAVSAPVVVGPKWPWMLQLAPTARLVPQLLAKTNEDALAPVTAMLVMVKAAVPVLVMVTDCELLAEPTAVAGKARLVADRVTGGTTPVPLSAILCGELAALSVMVMDAVSEPPAAGAKCPWMLQFAPAARLVPQLLAKSNDEASAPVTVMLVMVSAAVPLLVTVTDWEALIAPTFTDPKARLVADKLTGGSAPVPLRVILCGEPGALSVMVMDAFNAPPVVGAKWP